MHVIPNLSFEIDNNFLEAIPSLDEVKRVIFYMDGDSMARPNGFTGKLFTFTWEVIAQNVYKAIITFFCGANLQLFVTSTSIVLLSKIMNPQDFT